MSASFTQLFIDAAEAKRVYVSKLSEEERKEDMIADIVL